jgi:hypothetical protein
LGPVPIMVDMDVWVKGCEPDSGRAYYSCDCTNCLRLRNELNLASARTLGRRTGARLRHGSGQPAVGLFRLMKSESGPDPGFPTTTAIWAGRAEWLRFAPFHLPLNAKKRRRP